MNSPKSFEQDHISALADGEVPGEDFAHALANWDQDPQSTQSWHTYHLIGDVMRSDALAPTTHALAFWDRLETQLALEPTRITPCVEATTPALMPQRSANDATMRWKWLAGVSFSMLVAVVVAGGWQMQGELVSQLPVPQVAATQEPPVMVRDAELDALMAAHQQLGGHSAFQMPSGFLRNATFERPQR